MGTAMTTPDLLAEDLGIGTLYYLMRDAVTVTDLATGLVVLANPAAERLFGAPADQLVGQSVATLVPQHLRESVLAQLETYRTTGTTTWVGATEPVELDVLRTDGAVVQAEFIAHQITVADRHFAVAFTRDVTERKRAEQAIQSSERELRALFAAMSELVIVLDRDGRYVQIAPTSPALLVRPPEELIGRTVHEVMPTAAADVVQAGLGRALDEDCTVGIAYELEIEGVPRSFEATLSPIGGDRVFCVARDATERLRAEDGLRASEARFRTVFDRAGTGIAVADLNGYPIAANPALCRMLGLDEAELRARSFVEVTHPDDVAADVALAQDLIAGVRDDYELEKRFIRSDGGVMWARLTVSLIRDGGGTASFAVAIVSDVTDRRRAEAAERERARLEGALLAARTAQHGLSNQLALTLGLTSLLAEDPRLDEELRELARQAADGAEGAARIVQRLQRTSRLAEVDQGGPGPVLDLDRSVDP